MYQYKLIVYTQTEVLDLTNIIEGDISLETEVNKASVFTFNVLNINHTVRIGSDNIAFFEGNTVEFLVNDKQIFIGRIVEKSRSADPIIKVKCYDLINYLAINKDTYTIKNMNLTQLLQTICDDFALPTGNIVDTTYIQEESIIKDNCNLLDIIIEMMDITLIKENKMYILKSYDNTVNLVDIETLVTPFIAEKGVNIIDYSYTTSIAKDVYNQIKLYQDNEETGKRINYIDNDSTNLAKWGVLQYYEKVNENMTEGEISSRLSELLANYNNLNRILDVTILGDESLEVDSGYTIYVSIDNIGDISINQPFVIGACKYKFMENYYEQQLTLLGEIKDNGRRNKRDYQ